jgi:hypothetical protein
MAKNRFKFQVSSFKFGVLSALFLVFSASAGLAATITEDFSSDPLQNGWNIFGETNLFQWDSTNHNLAVTWDSSQTNSYFYHPLGTILARDDDFTIEFDLRLNDILSGNEPGKTGPLEIGIGFFNLNDATNAGFGRGIYGGAPNIAEFDYFPAGYYDFGGVFPVDPTTTPTFISSSGFSYAPTVYAPYAFEIPTNQWVHVAMSYTASDQTITCALTTNGTLLVQLPDVVLTDTNTSGFADSDDFRADTFSISSYSSVGDDYDSVLAHGVVANIAVTVPPPPAQNLAGAFGNGVWQVQFIDRTNWLYTLERSGDFQTWTDVSPVTAGLPANLFLQDTNPPGDKAFYRVRASRP